MLRESLQSLIEECRKIKVAFQSSGYELHDYEDGAFADFRLQSINNLASLANMTKGFEVRIYANDDKLVLRIFENYTEE